MERTHPMGQDLDWLPRELKLGRWSVAGASWAGSLAAAGALTIASAGLLVHLAALTGAAGIYAGGRLGRAFMLRRLDRLARGRLDLVRVGTLDEGQLAHVAGHVAAPRETLSSFLHDIPGVYRRMVFQWERRRFVHESAIDFDVVDAAGTRIKVEVDDARLLIPPTKELASYPGSLFERPDLPRSLDALIGRRRPSLATSGTVEAAEFVLQVGAPVQIIGYKTDAVDPAIGTRTGRSPPMRPALRSGRVPLLITPTAPPDWEDGL